MVFCLLGWLILWCGEEFLQRCVFHLERIACLAAMRWYQRNGGIIEHVALKASPREREREKGSFVGKGSHTFIAACYFVERRGPWLDHLSLFLSGWLALVRWWLAGWDPEMEPPNRTGTARERLLLKGGPQEPTSKPKPKGPGLWHCTTPSLSVRTASPSTDPSLSLGKITLSGNMPRSSSTGHILLISPVLFPADFYTLFNKWHWLSLQCGLR